MNSTHRIRLLSVFSIVCVCVISGLTYYNWQLNKRLHQQPALTQLQNPSQNLSQHPSQNNGTATDPFLDNPFFHNQMLGNQQQQNWDPMQQIQQMQQHMNQMFSSAFGGGAFPQSSMTLGQQAQVEMQDEGKQYEVIVHVPDHQQAEVHSEIDGDRLSVSGKISNERNTNNNDFHSSMTSISQFSQSFYLPDAVNESEMVTKQDGNDIKIILPKA